MERLAAIVIPAAVVLSGLVGTSVARAAGTTLYVGAAASGSGGCVLPAYTSVQSAVDAAASGDTVFLCGTTPFAEQVFVNKKVTLTGTPGATLPSPATAAGFAAASSSRFPSQFQTDGLFAPQAILIATGTTAHLTLKGITVAGPLPGNGGCGEDEYGVLVIAGASAHLTHDTVRDIHDINPSLYGCQFGVGIQVGREYWPTAAFTAFKVENFVGQGQIDNTGVAGYQKNGMTIDGTGSSGLVQHSAVTGSGRDALFAPTIAQNGVQISRGATGQVSTTTVSDNTYTGAGFASAGGILVFGGCGDPLTPHVSIVGNTLVNNDVGIYLNNYDPSCSAPAPTPTSDQARNNTISNDAVTNTSGYCTTTCPGEGYQAGIDDIGNGDTIAKNAISGAGYAYADPPPAFVRPIDTTSFPTIDPELSGNTFTL